MAELQGVVSNKNSETQSEKNDFDNQVGSTKGNLKAAYLNFGPSLMVCNKPTRHQKHNRNDPGC